MSNTNDPRGPGAPPNPQVPQGPLGGGSGWQGPAGGAPQGGPPPGYGPPQGYGPPPGYGQPQGYNAPPGYGSQPAGYQPGFGAPTGGFGGPGYQQPWAAAGQPGYYRAYPAQPSNVGNVLAILGGGFIALCAFAVWFQAWEGYGTAFGAGLFLALGLWLGVKGITGISKKKLPIAAHLGIPGAIILLATLTGPIVGRSHMRSKEKDAYAKISKSTAMDYAFTQYETDIPEQFRRPEWRLQFFEMKIRSSGTDAAALRQLESQMDAEKNKDVVAPARDHVTKKLAELYDQGKARMYAKTGAANPEFPTDDSLRAAFGTVLADLANAPDPNVYVMFENSSDLTAPKGSDKLLEDYRHQPDAMEAFPKGNAPVVNEGQAFSPQFDSRRRQTFITAMSESFGRVFNGALITLIPLEKNDDPKGKIVIDVISKIHRDQDYYTYTNTDEAGKTSVIGILFAISVDWDFKIVGRDGKELYTAPDTNSKAAEHVKIDSQPTDPDWAPYSIMMDSAYYNYSRELNGRFGFEPPPVKDAFSYAASGADAKPAVPSKPAAPPPATKPTTKPKKH